MQFSLIALVSALAATTTATGFRYPYEPACGLTDDAVLSDCRKLIEDDATWADSWKVHPPARCLSMNRHGQHVGVFNPSCLGDCCLYTFHDERILSLHPGAETTLPRADIVRYLAQKVLGCQSEQTNSVNGQVFDEDYNYVCISNRDGCGDCYDDDGELDAAR